MGYVKVAFEHIAEKWTLGNLQVDFSLVRAALVCTLFEPKIRETNV